jgi:hypothetical protein
MTKSITVFIPNIGNRAKYIFEDIIPIRVKNTSWKLVDDLAVFKVAVGTKINYSEISVPESDLWIHPEGWLTDGNWRGLNYSEFNKGWVMFPQAKGDYSYDVFSAIFVMLARAEEYLVQQRDEHNRFSIHHSSYPVEMTHVIPWVDVWLTHFKEFLHEKGISIDLDVKVSSLMTVDVDNVTAVYGKPIVRQMGGALKHFTKIGPMQRISAAKNILNDPYYSFPLIKEMAESSKVPFHFFLLGGDRSGFDKNQNYYSKAYQTAIVDIKDWAEVGWHPGYYWNVKDFESQLQEKEALEKTLDREVTSSRMHFLRFDVRTTYQRLEELGILNDYTLGFADGVGFRAGTAHPFLFYSLAEERALKVISHPFVSMDATMNWYLKYTPSQAQEISLTMANYIKSFGGCLSFLWHNDTLCGFGDWAPWKSVFEYQLNLAKACLN